MANNSPTKPDLQDTLDQIEEILEGAYTPESTREDLAAGVGGALADDESHYASPQPESANSVSPRAESCGGQADDCPSAPAAHSTKRTGKIAQSTRVFVAPMAGYH